MRGARDIEVQPCGPNMLGKISHRVNVEEADVDGLDDDGVERLREVYEGGGVVGVEVGQLVQEVESCCG